jgi:hypothetical protein
LCRLIKTRKKASIEGRMHIRNPENKGESDAGCDHDIKHDENHDIKHDENSLIFVPIAAKPRAILTREQAIEIFKCRPNDKSVRALASSAAVAHKYGVSEKTVRDIWNGRTWHSETLPMDPTRPARRIAPPGRPPGRKDSAPRRRNSRQALEYADVHLTHGNRPGPSATKDLSDPFHDDWPHWNRSDDPLVNMSGTPTSKAESIGFSQNIHEPRHQADRAWNPQACQQQQQAMVGQHEWPNSAKRTHTTRCETRPDAGSWAPPAAAWISSGSDAAAAFGHGGPFVRQAPPRSLGPTRETFSQPFPEAAVAGPANANPYSFSDRDVHAAAVGACHGSPASAASVAAALRPPWDGLSGRLRP